MLVPVVLCGGVGSRLWPLSRHQYPKQFLNLMGNASLFQSTIQRLAALDECTAPLILANESHRFIVAEQLRAIGKLDDVTIILEPALKNTAPACALAALQALSHYPEDSTLLVLPSDHWIPDIEAFARSVRHAQCFAADDQLVTFGVEPTRPETGYGYLSCTEELDMLGACRVDRFIEKPDASRAKDLVAMGSCFWNSGMFVFSAEKYLETLQTCDPEIYEAVCRSHRRSKRQYDFIWPDAAEYEASPSDSIDYAIMEKSDDVVMVPLQSSWSDVGSWDQLSEQLDSDTDQNQCVGDVVTLETKGSLIHSSSRLVATMGVENLVIIETSDAVLVTDKKHAQSMKELIGVLEHQNRTELRSNPRVHRPWGYYETLEIDNRYQVKRISVKVGGKLSLQLHHHRSEHWVVVRGSAKVTCGDDIFLLTENQSTHIPIGAQHALENVGKITLELIEVQSGSYLGEDDIVRLDDAYGRHISEENKEEVI